jgi:hypothetical protein
VKILAYLKNPIIAAVVAGLGGIILGLIWGWGIQPVTWKDAPPSLLTASAQETYLRMAIDSYGVNGDAVLARQRYQELGKAAPDLLATIQINPGTQNPLAIVNFTNLVKPASAVATPTPAGGTTTAAGLSKFVRYLIIGLVIAVVAIVALALVWRLYPNLFRRGGELSSKLFRRSGKVTPAQQAQQLSQETERTDFTSRVEGFPNAQFITTYVLGDDLFDDSFGIDSPAGEFMGECGVGISETIGVGDPKKVTAFEVWLFDKNDIQTVTKVLMSSHAFNDAATFQRLEAKGEPILVEPHKQFVLETAALQMMATVADVEYGKGALPDESYFERLTLELAIWPKATPPV